MRETKGYARCRFAGLTGYVVSPEMSGHDLVSVRHSALVAPWADGDVHLHAASDEFYLLLHGRLQLLVGGEARDLQPGEMLCVRAGVAHAVIGGEGRIEHFVFRAPARADRVSLGPMAARWPAGAHTRTEAPSQEDGFHRRERKGIEGIPAGSAFSAAHQKTIVRSDGEREIEAPWGYRIALADARNHNCWLIGLGAALHRSADLLFAYLDFPTHEAANAGMGTRLRLHRHERSWEYYACLAGRKTLLIDGEQVPVGPGEMVEVRPGAAHNVVARQAPYVGFTFRVPLLQDKVEV